MRPTRSDSMLHTMMAASVTVTELGFLQECQLWRLRSPHFPSKVGGRPAWLGEVGVPGPENLQCGVCMKPLAFLLQVYAPCTGSFHRTIFLFTCRDPVCHRVAENRCYKVFRNQLPRKNDTYSYGPPPDSPPPHGEQHISFQLKCGLRLCRVCGCLGPKSCSRCHKVSYCDRLHQLMDWKSQHKELCGQEFESSMDDLKLNEDELTALAKHENEEDKAFSRFKKQISIEPDQVLRYCKGGEPLWISLQYVPAENDILNCECGAKRAFEFQVMPQLLNHLKVDSLQKSIDWGVLAVYTCSANCKAETRYVQEFLWKQDVPADTM
ncbi:programmed cell death protein 2 isoform X2 [Rhinoderma darwinii]|uniref:programmed cell death protein 2 isoform X2 n=1 Tax=Rhinoderma darwinii TaxID=43563 RepID=UPI003F67EB92